jgi:hypothetical protein
MAKTPLTVTPQSMKQDSLAEYIANTWFTHNSQRRKQLDLWQEIRNYVFATDTSTTTNKSLPWKNSTTIPKLCQIRDNLHSNYISALFPNDNWLKWEAHSVKDAAKAKVAAIEAYMSNKTRIGGFYNIVDKLVYDYIDYGNAFATADYETTFKTNKLGQRITDFTGPVARRISPLDIVFNPLAESFESSWKIVRSVKTIGELQMMAEDVADKELFKAALDKRSNLIKACNSWGADEFDKATGFQLDGFGNYFEYLQSGYVEILTFYGDIYDAKTGQTQRTQEISVIDRMFVVSHSTTPDWFGGIPIYHVGWRRRTDNLWAMGPLDNLVGMQYRIDHLENLKADAMDLAIYPPLVVAGDVEEFDYGPGVVINIDDQGQIAELGKNLQGVMQADNNIQLLEARMEMFAGAPREAMGIRTQGEKTAFEVQQLQNAAGRIFQEKIKNFEINLIEPTLNAMLERAARNVNINDEIAVMDDDLNAKIFRNITSTDITATGVIRPIGSRHFAMQAQLLQNLQGLTQSNVWPLIAPHISGKNMAGLIEDVLGLSRYEVVRPNIAVHENIETQQTAQSAQENAAANQLSPEQAEMALRT